VQRRTSAEVRTPFVRNLGRARRRACRCAGRVEEAPSTLRRSALRPSRCRAGTAGGRGAEAAAGGARGQPLAGDAPQLLRVPQEEARGEGPAVPRVARAAKLSGPGACPACGRPPGRERRGELAGPRCRRTSGSLTGRAGGDRRRRSRWPTHGEQVLPRIACTSCVIAGPCRGSDGRRSRRGTVVAKVTLSRPGGDASRRPWPAGRAAARSTRRQDP